MSEAESSPKQQHEISLNVADPLCGRVLNGRFSIIEPIGSGGMGKVYKAIQSPLDRVVALKVLHPHFANSKDPGFVKRFVLEASLTSKLRHPNTVTVIDYGQTEDGIFYIAMEYLEGHTVAEMLAKTGAIAWQRAIGIGQQVCRSLREAHKFGILHRDLKPANVMLLDEADNDVVKVLDFGLVKSFLPDAEGMGNPQITQSGMLLGSPQYMAPEQAKNQTDPRSDIYSFGILLYEMLTTRPPFQAKDYLEVIVKHIKDPPPTFRQMRPDLDIPVEVERVVMRCLEKEMHHRYASMDELLDALRLVGGGQVGLSSSFQAQQQASQTGKWAIPAGTTPPPLPGQRGMVTPNPNNPSMMPATPAPSGNVPTGAHMRQPTGQFYHLTQPQPGYGQPGYGQTPAPSSNTPAVPMPLFGAVSRTAAPVQPEPQVPAEPNLFSMTSSEEKGGGAKIAGIAAVAAVLLGVAGWLLSADTKPAGPETAKVEKPADAKPADPAATAAASTSTSPAKSVRFKVATDPAGAQVFMGARDLGKTPTSFEIPPGADGTATAELVFILDGHHPLAVTAGGSGDVLITQRLQRKSEPRTTAVASSGGSRIVRSPPRDEQPETIAPPPEAPRDPVAAAPKPSGSGDSSVATAGGFQSDPYAEPSGYSASATASAAANRQPVAETVSAPVVTPEVVTASAIASAPALNRASDGAEILPFGDGMERPVALEGKPLQYTREALAAKVEGLMLVKCVLTTAGRVENCRVIKSLPYMEKAVLEQMYTRRYQPVTFNGRPVAVSYVFDVKVSLPRR